MPKGSQIFERGRVSCRGRLSRFPEDGRTASLLAASWRPSLKGPVQTFLHVRVTSVVALLRC